MDLGQIDLLVQEGFYANRTDFIRTAIRAQLGTRASAVDQTVARRTLVLGTQHYSRRDLEDIRDAGKTVHIRVLGLASIANDVSPELALATIASVEAVPGLLVHQRSRDAHVQAVRSNRLQRTERAPGRHAAWWYAGRR